MRTNTKKTNQDSTNSTDLQAADKKVAFKMAVKDQTPELDDPFDVSLEDRRNPTYNDAMLIERMASAFLSEHEICAIIKLPRCEFDTNLLLKAAFARGAEMGKASLRRLQWKSAQSNPVMQIFLGKQYLGQADKVETSKGEDKGAAYKQFIDKLKNVIDVSPARSLDGEPQRGGEGGREVLLAPVGEAEPIAADSRRLDETPDVTSDHSSLERPTEKSRPGVFAKLEDMVIASGKRKRKDSLRSGVGKE